MSKPITVKITIILRQSITTTSTALNYGKMECFGDEDAQDRDEWRRRIGEPVSCDIWCTATFGTTFGVREFPMQLWFIFTK